MSKKKKTEIEIGVCNSGKSILIPFDTIFNQQISHTNEFNLSYKKNFVNLNNQEIKGDKTKVIHHYLSEDLQFVMNNIDDFPLTYLYLKTKMIDLNKDYSEEEFIDDIFTEVITQEFIDLIDSYIEDSYTINLDDNTSVSNSKNEELQFTDEHAKIVLKTAMTARILIPIIIEFMNYHSTPKNDALFLKIFDAIFGYYQPENINIRNKLFKLIDARIVAKRYSDRVIWSYLQNVSKSPEVLAREFYRNIIVNIIPKINNNSNIVSYLHVIIKNKILYEFKKKFSNSFKPIDVNQEDEEGVNEFDKISINQLKSDEGKSLMNVLTIPRQIKFVMKKFDIEISKEEYMYYENILNFTVIHKTYTGLFFAKYLGSFHTIYSSDAKSYLLMIIVTYKWMKLNNLNSLAKYLIAEYDPVQNEKKTIHKKQFINQFLMSKEYKELICNKYGFTMEQIVNSKLLIKMFALLAANKFIEVNDYETYLKTETISIGEELDEKIELITSEILKFARHV